MFNIVKTLGDHSIVELYYGKYAIINTSFVPFLDGMIFLDEKDAEKYLIDHINKSMEKWSNEKCPNCDSLYIKNDDYRLCYYTFDGIVYVNEACHYQCPKCKTLFLSKEVFDRRVERLTPFFKDDKQDYYVYGSLYISDSDDTERIAFPGSHFGCKLQKTETEYIIDLGNTKMPDIKSLYIPYNRIENNSIILEKSNNIKIGKFNLLQYIISMLLLSHIHHTNVI